ncbi:peptidoglycan-binding protein [Streptomyces sp. NPDC095613]|uniref:peptidoglycan-binding protein n=1 Tax=Streptomyces sp. NPDC095613 TaxID=3155540 RepID=UPI00332280F4
MSNYHVAVDHLNETTLQPSTTYYGTVDQAHVDEIRAIAALETTGRHIKEHPRLEGAFCVLRDDGDLDVYVPVDAPEDQNRVREPEPQPTAAAPDDLPRGASGPAYISGATRFGGQSIGGAMDTPSNPPRATWHTTESPAGGSYFTSIAAYLIRVGAEPQVIYDPVTDRIGQLGPLNQSARALKNDGTRRTNREGRVNIQVEVLGRAAAPWTKGFDPSAKPNFRALLAAMRAHGIPDVWPAGKPPATAALAASGSRSRRTWQSRGGHYAHAQVPGNNHWDPGAIDTSIVPGKPAGHDTGGGTSTPTQQHEPFPGAAFFHTGRNSPIVTAMGRRLVAEGCGKYKSGPGPNWTLADKASYAAWQRKLGYSGADADGIPGKTSWDKLRVSKSL